jgi:hypothetical protein
MTQNSNISGRTKKLSTENNKQDKKTQKKEQNNQNRRESGKPKTDLFENRPSVGFLFIENRSVSVSVSVSRRALIAAL